MVSSSANLAAPAGVDAAKEAPVDKRRQALERIRLVGDDRLDGVEREAAGEHGEASQQCLLWLR